MPISLLRRPSRPRSPSVAPALGLSLPASAPLIEPGRFAAGVGFPSNPTGYFSGHSSPDSDSNSPHSPYSPSLTNSYYAPPSPPPTSSRAPSLVRDPHGNAVTSFHRPFSSTSASTSPTAPAQRRAKARRMAVLTVMVVGPSGAGKSSFIDTLTTLLSPDTTPLRSGTTTRVVRHEVSASGRRFVFLDTPGLPASPRGRTLNALSGIVEARLAHQLSEENKVVRRKSDGAELVHLIIYALDARTALVTPPTLDIDWDTIAEPKAAGRPASHIDPGGATARLPIEDIEAIRRFSIRGNVLPILTHADALTTAELAAVRHAVVRDLATVFGRDPLGAWGILSSGAEPDAEEPDDAEPDPAVPYAVFSPEPHSLSRAFRWGRADAADPAHSDLAAVREVLMTSADWLRTSTREVVYEKFRTEMLLNARGVGPNI